MLMFRPFLTFHAYAVKHAYYIFRVRIIFSLGRICGLATHIIFLVRVLYFQYIMRVYVHFACAFYVIAPRVSRARDVSFLRTSPL